MHSFSRSLSHIRLALWKIEENKVWCPPSERACKSRKLLQVINTSFNEENKIASSTSRTKLLMHKIVRHLITHNLLRLASIRLWNSDEWDNILSIRSPTSPSNLRQWASVRSIPAHVVIMSRSEKAALQAIIMGPIMKNVSKVMRGGTFCWLDIKNELVEML